MDSVVSQSQKGNLVLYCVCVRLLLRHINLVCKLAVIRPYQELIDNNIISHVLVLELQKFLQFTRMHMCDLCGCVYVHVLIGACM